MSTEESACQRKQNRFLSLSEGVTACAAHPLNGTIVAGTEVCASPYNLTAFAYYISVCPAFNLKCSSPD